MQISKVKNNLHIIADWRWCLCVGLLSTILCLALVSYFCLSFASYSHSLCLSQSIENSQRLNTCRVDVEILRRESQEMLSRVTGKPEKGVGGDR